MTTSEKITTVISLVALCASVWAIKIAGDTSYQVEIVAEKREALSQFVEATGNLQTDIDLRFRNIPYRFEDISIVAAFTEQDMRVMQSAALGWFRSYRDFTTKVNASRDAWPNQIQEKIMLAGDSASQINKCLSVVEHMPADLPSGFWSDKKAEMLKVCPSFISARTEFNDRSQEVIKAMREDRKAAWDEEKPSEPDPKLS